MLLLLPGLHRGAFDLCREDKEVRKMSPFQQLQRYPMTVPSLLGETASFRSVGFTLRPPWLWPWGIQGMGVRGSRHGDTQAAPTVCSTLLQGRACPPCPLPTWHPLAMPSSLHGKQLPAAATGCAGGEGMARGHRVPYEEHSTAERLAPHTYPVPHPKAAPHAMQLAGAPHAMTIPHTPCPSATRS